MTDIHSCSYYCDRPECVKAQRDELRDKLVQPEQEDGCPVCGSDVHDRDALDKAEREIERLTALVKPALMQEPVGVKGYAMALNEVALKLRARYQNDLLSTPLWAEFEKARNKFASSIATPPAAQRKPLTDVIKAAQGVLEWTEITHRPPVRDRLEIGRMAMVRVHALADLHDALASRGIKEKQCSTSNAL